MFNKDFVDGLMHQLKQSSPDLSQDELEKQAGQAVGNLLSNVFDLDAVLNPSDAEMTKQADIYSGGYSAGNGFLKGLAGAEIGKKFAESASGAMGGIAAGAVGGAALYALGKGMMSLTDKSGARFEQALKAAVERNPVLRSADPKKVRDFAESIMRFAPSIAQDPNLLATVLANAVQGESLDPTTIKQLVEIQERHNKNSDSLGGIKNMLLKG